MLLKASELHVNPKGLREELVKDSAWSTPCCKAQVTAE